MPRVRRMTKDASRYAPREVPICAEGDVLPYRAAKAKAMHEFHAVYFRALLERSKGSISGAARAAGFDRAAMRQLACRNGVDLKVLAAEIRTTTKEST